MDVLMNITGRQTVDGQCEVTEVTAPGRMTPDGDGWELTYRETSPEGEETQSIIRVMDGGMEVERRGGVSSLLRLVPGQRLESDYDAGVGVLRIGIETQMIRSSLSPAGGAVEARYTLDIGPTVTAEHRLTIEVERIE